MHHYWVKEAGDPEAIGEYFPEERGDGVPIYRSQWGSPFGTSVDGLIMGNYGLIMVNNQLIMG